MKNIYKQFVRTALAGATLALAGHAIAQVTLYEREGFSGKSYVTSRAVANLERQRFNDRASSLVVAGKRWERWEVCDAAGYTGRCVVLRPGNYTSLASLGLDNRVSSLRAVDRNARVDDARYAPPPVATYDARRRANERLYTANVTSVRAVVGPPEQRCWVEREQVAQERSGSNVPGTVVGAVLGGILGHQVGDGRGRDLATVGGAVAGGAVGATVGRSNPQPVMRDIQRCSTVPAQARTDLWDVTYNFRGQEHHVQMTSPPGATVTVNGSGEPRVG